MIQRKLRIEQSHHAYSSSVYSPHVLHVNFQNAVCVLELPPPCDRSWSTLMPACSPCPAVWRASRCSVPQVDSEPRRGLVQCLSCTRRLAGKSQRLISITDNSKLFNQECFAIMSSINEGSKYNNCGWSQCLYIHRGYANLYSCLHSIGQWWVCQLLIYYHSVQFAYTMCTTHSRKHTASHYITPIKSSFAVIVPSCRLVRCLAQMKKRQSTSSSSSEPRVTSPCHRFLQTQGICYDSKCIYTPAYEYNYAMFFIPTHMYIIAQ